MNNKKQRKYPVRDRILVEKIIILDCFASLAMTIQQNLISTLFQKQNNLSRVKDNTHIQTYYLIAYLFPASRRDASLGRISPQQRLRAEQLRFFKSFAVTRT
ncbi:MAG: hypothetical protein LBF04_07095 [Prevotellaceae bacterium]|jgi:hypothetical protein|nr:hypothetical protein [Prevotellaceae bacterium]